MNHTSIRELRSRLQETQAQFASRFSVTPVTVAGWESGRTKPTKARANALSLLASTTVAPPPAVEPFRPIQYLGSKQRLAQTIAEVIDEINPERGRVGDLFAGTGVVSHTLGRLRPVTSVDVQAYSGTLLRTLLTAKPADLLLPAGDAFTARLAGITAQLRQLMAPLLKFEADAIASAERGQAQALIELIDQGSIAMHRQRPLDPFTSSLAAPLVAAERALASSGFSTADVTATYYFGGPYFAYEQAIVLDAINIASKELSVGEKNGLAAVLLSTASEIVNTVGKQFAQPMKLQKSDGKVQPLLLKRALRDRSLDVFTCFHEWTRKWQARIPCGAGDHRVFCGDVQEFVTGDHGCSVFYADPPYTIDHYSRFYHVLETLVLRDSPPLDEMKKRGQVVPMRGVYRAGRYQSPFCIPSQAEQAFDRLFAATARTSVPLVLSYSPFDEQEGQRSRLVTLDTLVSLAERYYPNVELVEILEHSHRKLNTKAANSSSRSDAERLLICKG